MATRFIVLAFAAFLALPLASCDTVHKDIQTSAADTRAIFTDFSMEKLLADSPEKSSENAFSLADSGIRPVEMVVIEETIPANRMLVPVPGARPERNESMQISSAQESGACPDVRIVSDLNQVHQFAGNDTSPQYSLSSIRMLDVTPDCKIGSKNVAIEMTLAFEGDLGPKGRARETDTPSFAYPYFVAITNSHGNIVAKEVFAVTLTYENHETSDTKIEKVRQVIPVASNDIGNYKILVGFQLNDEELAYNRTLPSGKVDMNSIQPAAGTGATAAP